MVDPLQVLTMIDVANTKPSLRWGGETTKRDMLVHWYQINLAKNIAFQCDKKYFLLEEDMMSSDWVKYLLTNSSKSELKQRVDEKFYKIDPLQQGGITYLKFFLTKHSA